MVPVLTAFLASQTASDDVRCSALAKSTAKRGALKVLPQPALVLAPSLAARGQDEDRRPSTAYHLGWNITVVHINDQACLETQVMLDRQSSSQSAHGMTGNSHASEIQVPGG
jgi:hypothetical protein